MTDYERMLGRALSRGGRSFKLPTTGQLAAVTSRMPLPSEGLLDGGAPYGADEMELMFQKELAREMDVHPSELTL
jgi:hypothetical protein